jgi:hypothetical protein
VTEAPVGNGQFVCHHKPPGWRGEILSFDQPLIRRLHRLFLQNANLDALLIAVRSRTSLVGICFY